MHVQLSSIWTLIFWTEYGDIWAECVRGVFLSLKEVSRRTWVTQHCINKSQRKIRAEAWTDEELSKFKRSINQNKTEIWSLLFISNVCILLWTPTLRSCHNKVNIQFLFCFCHLLVWLMEIKILRDWSPVKWNLNLNHFQHQGSHFSIKESHRRSTNSPCGQSSVCASTGTKPRLHFSPLSSVVWGPKSQRYLKQEVQSARGEICDTDASVSYRHRGSQVKQKGHGRPQRDHHRHSHRLAAPTLLLASPPPLTCQPCQDGVGPSLHSRGGASI